MELRMGETTKIDDRGTVTVPKQIRDKLDIRSNQYLSMTFPTKPCVTFLTVQPRQARINADVHL
jgi:AbrB family looped-hinge helix DNA binding protein